MTEHNDPKMNQFVTKVMEMAPDAPAYPAPVVATPERTKRFPTWIWAPVAAVVVLLAIVPIALRSGDSGEIVATGNPSTTIVNNGQTDTGAIDIVSPAPTIDAERNTLTAVVATVSPGSVVELDFTGDKNVPRSEVYWMDRFDYAQQQWFSEYVLWSDRAEGGMRSATSAAVTIAVPEPTVNVEGFDHITVPSVPFQLGTYRVCVALISADTPCALLEVTDAMVVPNTTIPPFDDAVVVPAEPDFGLLATFPGDDRIIVVPYQFLIGPDADQVAIEDGYIAAGETLPNGFYLRPLLNGSATELEPSADFEATVLDPNDPSITIALTFDEWVSWVLPKPGGTPGSGPGIEMYGYLTYDTDGRVLTITEQYIP